MCGSAMCSARTERRLSALRTLGAAARMVVCAASILLALSLAAGPAAAQRPGEREDESAQFVVEARNAVRDGRLRDAARSLDQALQLDRPSIDAYVLRGRVYELLAQHRQGIALMRRALLAAPDHPEVLARLGVLLLEVDAAAPPVGAAGAAERPEWIEGVALLEDVVRRDRRRQQEARDAGARRVAQRARVDALLALGQMWRRRGEHRRAIVALRTYLEVRPSDRAGQDAEMLVALADSYLRARLPAAAAARLAAVGRRQAAPAGESAEAVAAASRRRAQAELARAMVAASVDCATAEPLLRALETMRREALLVRGRCALVLGKQSEAIELATQYLAERGASRAIGLGLLGDIAADQGNLLRAKELYESALGNRPGDRGLLVRRAALYRRAGQLGTALDMLRSLAPSAAAEAEPLWWQEMGKVLLVRGGPEELADFRRRLAALLTERIDEPADEELFAPASGRLADERLWALLGELDLKLGQSETAVSSLLVAQRLRKTAATAELLERAMARTGVEQAAARLAAGDAVAADQLLTALAKLRSKVAPGTSGAAMTAIDAALWRNLGVARLALGRGGPAAEAFERATVVAPGAINSMLLARAAALTGDLPRARRAYEQAAKLAVGEERLEVALDRASFELASREPYAALEVLRAVAEAPGAAAVAAGAPASAPVSASAPLGDRYRAALATARHAAGLAALRAGQSNRALELLQAGARPDAPLALRCDHALAKIAAQSGEASREVQKLGKLQCPFAAQGEGLALKILGAAAESETPARAKNALGKLLALSPRVAAAGATPPGPAAGSSLWSSAVRVAALNAASEAYRQWQSTSERSSLRAGYLVAARQHLRRARQAQAGFGEDELALGEAVLELADARVPARVVAAEARLEALATRMPEAELHLGLALHQRAAAAELGAARLELDTRALAAWRRARRGGARAPLLNQWILAKERLEDPRRREP